MTVTLDGKTLDVVRVSDEVETVGTGVDAWENEQYKRKLTVYGSVNRWRLECEEVSVAWANSCYSYFKGVAKAGTTVTFVVDEGTLYQVNANVKVVGLGAVFEPGEVITRRFYLVLQEQA